MFLRRKKRKFYKRDAPRKTNDKIFAYGLARADSDKKPDSLEGSGRGTPGYLRRIATFFNYLLASVVIVSLFYLSILNTDPVIKIEALSMPRNEADYKAAITAEINRSLLYKNKLTFNSSRFSQQIKKQFPEVDSVIIGIPVIKHRPTVTVVVSQPAARLITKNGNFILDREGRALFEEYALNPSFDPGSLVSITDASGHQISLGEPALTNQQIVFIRSLIDQGKANKTPPVSFSLEFGGSAVDVRFKDTDYFVKFSFYEDVRQSIGAYFALKEKIEQGKAAKPSQYIDLRIPDRAYVK